MKLALTSEWKRRLIIAGLLFAIYWGVQLGDWIISRYILVSPQFAEGASRITLRHFRQPDEHPFSLTYWKVFLDRVTRNKPGILAWKSFYLVLLGAYVASALWLFLELTSDRLWNRSDTDA